MSFISKNPYTEQVIKTFEEISDDVLQNKIALAQETFLEWKNKTFSERAVYVKKLAELLRAQKRSLGELATMEMGKPIMQAMAEVEKCAWVCEYAAENAEKILAEEKVVTDAAESYIRFDPLGVILEIMPWNFPFWQVLRVSAGTVMAGNTVLLKHASNVPRCAAKIEELFLEAGFPEGVLQNLFVGIPAVEKIICHEAVKAVSLTGSERAGSSVASIAAREIKKTVMELGGSDAFIVLDDADLDFTCPVAVAARIQNNGQSCMAAKRFIVMESIVDDFIERFKNILQTKVIGDPMNGATEIGPLTSEAAVDQISSQVERSVALGATVTLGGKKMDRTGFFYEPTILSNVKKGMPAYDEELFGYVASVIIVKDEKEAVQVANDTRFGLDASIWTTNVPRAKAMIHLLDVGGVFINAMPKSDPRLPVGGTKKSGYGRELSSYGMKEFTNIKTVWIK